MNLQGGFSSVESLRTLLNMVHELDSNWGVLFLSEIDFVQSSSPDYDFDLSPHLTWRHWPGEGSRAMRFVVHARFKHLFRNILWEDRCGA